MDKLCAHTAFAFMLLHDSRQALSRGASWLLLFPSAVAVLWGAQSLWPDRAQALHAALHMVAVTGVHCWLVCL